MLLRFVGQARQSHQGLSAKPSLSAPLVLSISRVLLHFFCASEMGFALIVSTGSIFLYVIYAADTSKGV